MEEEWDDDNGCPCDDCDCCCDGWDAQTCIEYQLWLDGDPLDE